MSAKAKIVERTLRLFMVAHDKCLLFEIEAQPIPYGDRVFMSIAGPDCVGPIQFVTAEIDDENIVYAKWMKHYKHELYAADYAVVSQESDIKELIEAMEGSGWKFVNAFGMSDKIHFPGVWPTTAADIMISKYVSPNRLETTNATT